MKEIVSKALKGLTDWKTTVPGTILAGSVFIFQHMGVTEAASAVPDLLTGIGYVVSAVLVLINTKPKA